MKKNNFNSKVIKAVLCVSTLCTIVLPSTITPASAYDGALPISINQIMMEGGAAGTVKHDTDMLRYKRDEKEITEDYRRFDQNRNFEGNGGGQVIQDNTNYSAPNSGYMQGQVQDINTQGVYVNSIEVAPSQVLSKEEVNNSNKRKELKAVIKKFKIFGCLGKA